MSGAVVPTSHSRAPFLGSTEEIEVAIERGEVSFPMFMKLLYRNLRPAPPEFQERLSDLYFRALPLFMANCGGINESFYADEFVAGVLITLKDELHFNAWWDEFNFDTIPARSLESDFNDLRLKARLYLSQDPRKICNARLFRLYKTLITCLHLEYRRSHVAGPHCSPEFLADIEQLRREFGVVVDNYCRSAREHGQLVYVAAAALGTAVIVAMAGIAVAFSGFANAGIWPGVIAGGALGAFLSVLERLTRGALAVQFESSFVSLAVSGFSRPVVGSLSGMALYMLVKGGFALPIIKGGTESDQGFFFTAVAFLAGFIERLLKDVIGKDVLGKDAPVKHAATVPQEVPGPPGPPATPKPSTPSPTPLVAEKPQRPHSGTAPSTATGPTDVLTR